MLKFKPHWARFMRTTTFALQTPENRNCTLLNFYFTKNYHVKAASENALQTKVQPLGVADPEIHPSVTPVFLVGNQNRTFIVKRNSASDAIKVGGQERQRR